jgi:hypothetical protein
MPRINEQALKKELAKRGFESVSIKRELPGRRVKVDANKLYPVQVEGGEPIYAPVPMSLSVELDARAISNRLTAMLRIRLRSQMPRGISKRYATAGSWLALEHDSQRPVSRIRSSATNKAAKCCGANGFRLAKGIAGQSTSRAFIQVCAKVGAPLRLRSCRSNGADSTRRRCRPSRGLARSLEQCPAMQCATRHRECESRSFHDRRAVTRAFLCRYFGLFGEPDFC